MNFLFHGKKVDKETLEMNEWMNLFDLIVVGSCKPAYLIDPYLNLFRVRNDGSLKNTDGKGTVLIFLSMLPSMFVNSSAGANAEICDGAQFSSLVI